MSSPALTPAELSALLPRDARLRPIGVDAFLEMVRTGLIGDDERVELIEGWIVDRMPSNPPHLVIQRRLENWLRSRLGTDWYAGIEQPIILPKSVPVSDVAVVRGTWEDYATHHPDAGAIGLVIEVADSTVARDRRTKRRIYAAAEIPMMWLVNVQKRMIEVNTIPNPDEGRYMVTVDYRVDQDISCIIDGNLIGALRVGEILT